ncbi:MAG: Gfo/Idh/MocA family oxidoreductase, partial [Acidobacteriota bacterium]
DNLNLYSSLAFELPYWCKRRYLQHYLDFVEQNSFTLSSRYIYSFAERKKDPAPLLIKRNFVSRDHQLKVGLIGTGAFGIEWLRRLSTMDDIAIEAIVDRDVYTAGIVAQNYNCKVCSTDPAEIIENDKIKIVFIVTDHASHAPLVIEALKKKKFVYVEKPHVVNQDQLEQLVATVKNFPNHLQIGFNRRYAPTIVEAKHWLEKQISPINIQFNTRIHDVAPNSFYYWPEQGTRIISNTCHHLDLAYYLIGKKPLSISSFSSTIGRKDENVVISITFEDGSLATILFGDRGDCLIRNSIQIMKADLTININDFQELIVRESGHTVLKRKHTKDLGHVDAMRSFITSIKKNNSIAVSVEDIYWSGMLFLMADKAAKSGRSESFLPAKDTALVYSMSV